MSLGIPEKGSQVYVISNDETHSAADTINHPNFILKLECAHRDTALALAWKVCLVASLSEVGAERYCMKVDSMHRLTKLI